MARIAHTLRGRKLKAALSCRPCCRAVMFFAARNYCAFVQNLCHVGVSLHGAAHTHTHRHRAVVIDWKTSLQHTQNSLATSHAPLPSPCCACCNCLKAFAICYNALCSAAAAVAKVLRQKNARISCLALHIYYLSSALKSVAPPAPLPLCTSFDKLL